MITTYHHLTKTDSILNETFDTPDMILSLKWDQMGISQYAGISESIPNMTILVTILLLTDFFICDLAFFG